jgi:hypothetical protein
LGAFDIVDIECNPCGGDDGFGSYSIFKLGLNDTKQLLMTNCLVENDFSLNTVTYNHNNLSFTAAASQPIHDINLNACESKNSYCPQPLVCVCDCSCELLCFCETMLCGSCVPMLSGGLPSAVLTVSSMDKGALSQGADIEAYFASIPLVLSADTETIILQHPHLNEALSEFRRLILQIHAVNHVNFRTIIDDFRLGHYDDHQLVTERVNPPVGLELLKRVSHRLSYKQFACIDCYMKKIKAHPRVMKSSKINTHSPMANGHVDVIGPFLAHGHGGKKFAYLYICDDSSYVRLAWTKEHMTDLAVPVIQGWRFEANERGWAMHKIHFDSDPVFKSEQFRDQLAAMDIGTRYAPPGQHWVNGLMERFIQTICHNGYAMLRASGLPEKYFPFALSYATWLHNQHYRLRAVNASNPSYVGKVPYEVVHQRKYTGPRPALGQAVIARHSNPQQLAKLDDRGRLCAFLGIDELSHETLILLHLATGVVITSGDFHVLPNLYAWTMKPIFMDGKSTTIGSDTDFPREAMALSDELQHSIFYAQPTTCIC